ncbi:MAG: ATP-binding protein [Candidatus Schekmanbacteria bacterium]|nr:ATP-binding protein [Candidatus Schekmanbacteria bacterium]
MADHDPGKNRGRDAQPPLEQIREALEALRLPLVRERLDELLADPWDNLSRVEWLWELLEAQVSRRLEARIERRLCDSRLPVRKTLSSFDFGFQKGLDRDHIMELASLRFLDRGFNILLAGMSGTGKSHIAMALGLQACAANRRVRYTTSAEMLMALNASLASEALEETLKQYTRPELLIVDEVGLEQVERPGASRAGLMQKVLLPRYNHERSTIVTSNIPWESWGDYLGDHLGAAALLDRLIHRSHVIVIDGPSYRDHAHQRDVTAGRQRGADASAVA